MLNDENTFNLDLDGSEKGSSPVDGNENHQILKATL